jgi:hypothetical protein
LPNSDPDASARNAITTPALYSICFAIGVIFAVIANYIYTIDIGVRSNMSAFFLLITTAGVVLAPLRQLKVIKPDERRLHNRVLLGIVLGIPQGFALAALLITFLNPYLQKLAQ